MQETNWLWSRKGGGLGSSCLGPKLPSELCSDEKIMTLTSMFFLLVGTCSD